MLTDGMQRRGHAVEVWQPVARASRLPAPTKARKWLGYIDQYLVFPFELRRRAAHCAGDTVFVFTDNALGPWIPGLAHRPHVVHCHDFLAQRGALGEIPEHLPGWSGRCYQAFIRRGYRKARAFISVSHATQADLHRMLGLTPELSCVIPNGLNADFAPIPPAEARQALPTSLAERLKVGFIFHIGGNQWYKNRKGVLEAYHSYVVREAKPLPLVLAGTPLSGELSETVRHIPSPGSVLVLEQIPFSQLQALYSLATALLFPSIAEGFGWPIAEAMACGCPVITTDAEPMRWVGAEAAVLVPAMRSGGPEHLEWCTRVAATVQEVTRWSPDQRATVVETGLRQAERFQPEAILDQYAAVYAKACQLHPSEGFDQ